MPLSADLPINSRAVALAARVDYLVVTALSKEHAAMLTMLGVAVVFSHAR